MMQGKQSSLNIIGFQTKVNIKNETEKFIATKNNHFTGNGQ